MSTAYPLSWPVGWPRSLGRTAAPFHKKRDNGRGYSDKKPNSMREARDQLARELDLLDARGIVLSTNVELNLNGDPRGDRARPTDPGVACYFKLKGRDTVLACDKWQLSLPQSPDMGGYSRRYRAE